MKIQTKIFIFLLPLIVLPISFIGWTAYKRLQSESQENLKNQMISSLTLAKDKINEKVRSMEDNIVLYSQAEQISNYILSEDENQKYTIKLPPLLKLFDSYQAIFKDCIEMRIITKDGFEDVRLVSVRMKNKSNYEGDSSFFKELETSNRQTITTFSQNLDIGKFNMIVSQKIQLDNNPSKTSNINQHNFNGYLVVNCSLDYFQEQVDNTIFGKQGELFYTDGEGKILYHKNKNIINSVLPQSDFQNLKSLIKTSSNIFPVQLGNKSKYFKGEMIHSNLYLLATLPAIEYDSAGRTHWSMIVSGTILLTLIFIFGAILTIIKLLILVPMAELNRSIEKTGKGQLNAKLYHHRNDEIGNLSSKFNIMLEKLQTITVSHDYVDDILESMSDSIFVVSSKGIIKKVNAEACKLAQLQIEQLIGASILDFFSGNSVDIDKILNDGKKVINIELIMNFNTDNQYPVLFSTSSLLVAEGLDDRVCVIHDITDRIKTEKEKIKAQKIASDQSKHALIGRVAGKMAHDFNNVLGIIMGNSELALLSCTAPEVIERLELIFNQTIRGKNLTKNLIAFARSQSPKREFFNIDGKIKLVINLLKKDLNGIKILKEQKTKNVDVFADSGMMEHALVNLFQNAIHATSKSTSPQIIIRSYSSEHNVCFEIEDNGCGIPSDHLKSIYEPSFTLKGSNDKSLSYKTDIKGTGYGLANVKKYIDQHNGTIHVDSKVNTGSSFTICLPIVKNDLQKRQVKKTRSQNIHSNKSILLVEDEYFISDVQYRMLTQNPINHYVDIAPNGQIAIDLFNKKNYDLISLDYILPDHLNGMDVYNHIRKTDKKVKVLFVSGNLEFLESTKELKLKDNFTDHLSKPCQNIDYLNAINKLLDKADVNHTE